MTRCVAVCLLIVGTLLLGQVVPTCARSAEPGSDYLIGVNYFAGWWEPTPNKWQGPDKIDWRPKYPDRLPLLGQYNEQATMDGEIVAAATHGVDFFQILWYASDPGVDWGPNTERINVAVEQFLKSPEAHRMKFVVEYCNHPPFGVTDPQQWSKCVDFWVQCMQHPSYLRVGGKPVFKVHGSGAFYQQCGGTPEKVKVFLDVVRNAARKAGVGELLIGCGAVGPDPIREAHWVAKRFDFTSEYMDVPQLAQQDQEYAYENLSDWHARWRTGHTEDVIPSVPFLGSGWNPRPWGDPRPAFTLPNRQQWKVALQKLKADLDTGHFGYPLPNGKRQPAATLYCWNEFGEGGIIAPTQGEQSMKLEVIRDVFGDR